MFLHFCGEKLIKKSITEKFIYEYSDTGRFRAAVCYPNSYYVGMSNLGFHNLFDRVSAFHGVRVVRYFLEKNDGLYSPDAYIPQKRDMFTGRGQTLQGYDALFFTVSFELDYINILKMLSLSSIPLLNTERNGKFPFIIIGGIAVTANPEVLSVFSDIVFVGDMEENIEKILQILLESGFHKSIPLIKQLAGVDGVYIYSKKDAVLQRSITKDITRPSHSVVLTKNTEFSDMFLVEIIRGCRNTCSFCMIRCACSPVRSIRREHILLYINRALSCTKRIGLIGPALTDHSNLAEIVSEINELGCFVSFSSLRADDFNEETARLLSKNKQNTLTFAPEAGSNRLRNRIGKNLTNENLIDAVSIAIEYGIKKFRYYFMYGLPEETARDIRAITALVNKTAELFKKSGGSLHLSINPFIPKKGTPLENQYIYPVNYYMEMQKILNDELKNVKSVTVRFESLRYLYIHALLSIGDGNTGFSLYSAFIKQSLTDFGKYAGNILAHELN